MCDGSIFDILTVLFLLFLGFDSISVNLKRCLQGNEEPQVLEGPKSKVEEITAHIY